MITREHSRSLSFDSITKISFRLTLDTNLLEKPRNDKKNFLFRFSIYREY